MKNLRVLTIIAFIFIFAMFNNCGGGSCDTTQVVAIDAPCNDNNDFSNYIPIQSGDIVAQEEENTIINIIHNEDNEKSICVESGKANIFRPI